jgi:voltage-gated potassium channel
MPPRSPADNTAVSPSRPRLSPRLLRGGNHRVARAIGAAAAVVLLGTSGFMFLEEWPFWDALYFTLVTITTVGYDDNGLSPNGERFAAIILVGGIAIATYSLGIVVQACVERELQWERGMQKRIGQLTDHYIVCGLGRIGSAVCERLAAEGVAFVAVDPSEELIQGAAERGDLAMVGDATDDHILQACRIDRARGIACVASNDTTNIVITLTARELNPDLLIISRAEEEDSVRKIQRAGATRVISPSRTGGLSIANTILKPNLAELLDDSEDSLGVEFTEMTIAAGARLDGMTVDAYCRSHPAVVFVAVRHASGEIRLRPEPNETLKAGDVLIVAGDALAVGRLRDDAQRARAAA